MSSALQERLAGLRAFQEEVNVITAPDPTKKPETFEEVRQAYRDTREGVDLYGEALAARPYIAQLERRLADAESRLRTQSSHGKW